MKASKECKEVRKRACHGIVRGARFAQGSSNARKDFDRGEGAHLIA